MKVKKLICPKCGNAKEFRVAVQLNYVATSLTFYEDNEVELDTDFPDDVEVMCPVCAICGWELGYSFSASDWEKHSTKYAMCHSCTKGFIEDGDVVMETCSDRRIYPNCFIWTEAEAELNI